MSGLCEVPFYSQKWNLDDWKDLGFKDRADAEYWEKSSCGILCLKMAIDAFRLKQREEISFSVSEYIARGVALGSYRDDVGWGHDGLIILARTFGCEATRRERLSAEGLVKALESGYLPIISIKWAFQPRRSWRERMFFWKKQGGHLALVVGYEKDTHGTLQGFRVHHTSIREEYNWPNRCIPLDAFIQGFTGRAVFVRCN